MSRIFTAIASAVARDRVHECRLMTQERRRLSANFRALIPAGATITRAQWDIHVPGDVVMSAGQLSGPSTSVLIAAIREGGGAEIRCQVTLSTGEVLAQYFAVLVGTGPIFNDIEGGGGQTQIVVTP